MYDYRVDQMVAEEDGNDDKGDDLPVRKQERNVDQHPHGSKEDGHKNNPEGVQTVVKPFRGPGGVYHHAPHKSAQGCRNAKKCREYRKTKTENNGHKHLHLMVLLQGGAKGQGEFLFSDHPDDPAHQ